MFNSEATEGAGRYELMKAQRNDLIHCRFSCRLCLKKLDVDETAIVIDTDFRQQFFEMTQLTLDTSELYPQTICESCLEITSNFVAWKLQFVENQKILEDALIFENTIVDESSLLNSNIHLTDHCFTIQEEHLESESEILSQDALKKEIKPTKKHMKLCTDCGKTYSSQAYKRHFERVHLKVKNYHVSSIVILEKSLLNFCFHSIV